VFRRLFVCLRMQTAFIVLLAKAEKACTKEKKTALWVQNGLPAKEIVFFLGSL